MKFPSTLWILAIVIGSILFSISFAQISESEDDPTKLSGTPSDNDSQISGADGSDFSETDIDEDLDYSELSGARGIKLAELRKEIMKNPPETLLQLLLRNSDGQLVAYTETKEIMAIRPLYLMEYLDIVLNKEVITMNGNQYELIQWKHNEPTVNKKHSMAMYVLNTRIDGKVTPIMWMNHEAYQVYPGDQLEVYWTVLREL